MITRDKNVEDTMKSVMLSVRNNGYCMNSIFLLKIFIGENSMQKKSLLFLLFIFIVNNREMLSNESSKDVQYQKNNSTDNFMGKDGSSLKEELNGNSDADVSMLSSEEQDMVDIKAQIGFLEKSGRLSSTLENYAKEKRELFKQALYETLSENPRAIQLLHEVNQHEYMAEEARDKLLQDDAVTGSWGGSNPTLKSVNGRVLLYISNCKNGKSTINTDLVNEFNGHKNTFNQEIKPVLKAKLQQKIDLLDCYYLKGLDDCRTKECLKSEGVPYAMLLENDFFDLFINATFTPVIQEVKDKNIPLTREEIINIAKKLEFTIEGKTYSIAALEESKKKILTKLSSVLKK